MKKSPKLLENQQTTNELVDKSRNDEHCTVASTSAENSAPCSSTFAENSTSCSSVSAENSAEIVRCETPDSYLPDC